MLFICKKCTEVIKEQNVKVKSLSLFSIKLKLPVKCTLSARKHHPKTCSYCLGEAHVLYQSFCALEIK